MPAELPSQRALPEAVAPREEIDSSRLSLEEEINRFQLEEERKKQEDLVIHISDTEEEFNRFSGVHTSDLMVAKIDNSSEEEEEEMALNSRKGLKDLLVGRNKGLSFKEAPMSHPLPTLPSPPPPLQSACSLSLT